MDISLNDFISPILLSLKVVLFSSILVTILGFLAAWFMVKKQFFGKTVLETFFMLPLVLPPTIVGFILLMMLGRRSWMGQFAEWLLNQPLVFSWWAAVIAAVVMAFPLVYQTIKTGFLSVDKDLTDAGKSMGASEWQMMRYIVIPLSWRFLLTGYILGFARGLGEFGATLMVAGNIPGQTQTVSTAIYIAVDSGDMTLVWLWSVSLIMISFLLLLTTNKKSK